MQITYVLIIVKLYHLFLITAVLLFFVSRLLFSSQTIDIHVHDTYYIISASQVYAVLALICLLLWLLYFFITRFLFSDVLSRLHVFATLLSVFVIGFMVHRAGTLPRRYIEASIWNSLSAISNTFLIAVIVLLFAQLIFLLNIAGGLFKRIRK